MDELRLAIPDESLLDEIAAYRQAMLDADSSMGRLRAAEAHGESGGVAGVLPSAG